MQTKGKTMKKILTSAIATLLLAGSLQAANNVSDPIDMDFAKMNQYFNTLMQEHLNTSALNNINYPRTDIKETKKDLIIKFDLAGVQKENIKLTVNDDKILTISGEKKEQKVDKSENYVKKEIFYGSFKKMIQLPDNAEIDKLSTEFKDGILTITIPKKEIKKPKAKVIPIK
jgi:HSP20 family protein